MKRQRDPGTIETDTGEGVNQSKHRTDTECSETRKHIAGALSKVLGNWETGREEEERSRVACAKAPWQEGINLNHLQKGSVRGSPEVTTPKPSEGLSFYHGSNKKALRGWSNDSDRIRFTSGEGL